MTPLEFADSIKVKLWPEWRKVTKEFYDPELDYKEFIGVMGMKSGKTYHAGGLWACYELYLLARLDSPAEFFGLDPDSWIYGICAARSRKQAQDRVFAEFIAKAKRVELFQELNPEEKTLEYKLHDKKLAFLAGPSNSDALVSYTLAFAILDEMSRFKTTGGSRAAKPVYEAVSHQLGLLDGRLMVISSPLYKKDWTMQLLAQAKHSARMLGVQKATWIMNPLMPRDCPKIMDAFDRNPEAAARDYGAEPSMALEPFYREPERIDICIDHDRRHPLDAHDVLREWFHPLHNVPYATAGDPAYKNNAFGIAMGHREGEQYVIDLMHRFYNPYGEIDASAPRNLIDSLKAAGFLILKFGFDTWQFPETIAHIRTLGIDTVKSTVDLGMHSFMKELFYSGKLTVYRHEFALEEIKSLELVKGKKVDHRSGFSKDIADAVAHVCWLLRVPMVEKYDTKILRA